MNIRDPILGLGFALAVVTALSIIGLGAIGFFDQGTRYKFPQTTAAKEFRR